MIFGIKMEPISSTVTWALISQDPTRAITYGLTFGETEDILYNFAYQGTDWLISRIDSTNGSIIWNYVAIGVFPPIYFTIKHKVVSPTSNVLIIAAGQS